MQTYGRVTLIGDECSDSSYGCFTSGERELGIYWIGDHVGPRAVGEERNVLLQGMKP
jgi:hypothetical protein